MVEVASTLTGAKGPRLHSDGVVQFVPAAVDTGIAPHTALPLYVAGDDGRARLVRDREALRKHLEALDGCLAALDRAHPLPERGSYPPCEQLQRRLADAEASLAPWPKDAHLDQLQAALKATAEEAEVWRQRALDVEAAAGRQREHERRLREFNTRKDAGEDVNPEYLKDQLRDQAMEIAKLKSIASEVEGLKKHVTELTEGRGEYHILMVDHKELERRYAILLKESEAEREALEAVRRRARDHEVECKRLLDLLETRDAELHAARAELVTLRAERDATQRTSDETTSTIKVLAATRDEHLEVQRSEARRLAEALATREAEFSAVVRKARAECDELAASLRSRDRELEETRANLEATSQALAASERRHGVAVSKSVILEDALHHASSQAASARRDCETHRELAGRLGERCACLQEDREYITASQALLPAAESAARALLPAEAKAHVEAASGDRTYPVVRDEFPGKELLGKDAHEPGPFPQAPSSASTEAGSACSSPRPYSAGALSPPTPPSAPRPGRSPKARLQTQLGAAA